MNFKSISTFGGKIAPWTPLVYSYIGILGSGSGDFFSCRKVFSLPTGKEISHAHEAFLDEVVPIVADFKYDLLEPPSSTSVALSVACKKDLYQTLSNSMGLWGANHFVFSDLFNIGPVGGKSP